MHAGDLLAMLDTALSSVNSFCLLNRYVCQSQGQIFVYKQKLISLLYVARLCGMQSRILQDVPVCLHCFCNHKTEVECID